MAKKPADVMSLYYERERNNLDARARRIKHLAKLIEVTIDNALTTGTAEDKGTHYLVSVMYDTKTMNLDMASDVKDLESFINMAYQIAGWDRVSQRVELLDSDSDKHYFYYSIYKPVKAWQPDPSIDFNMIRRIGGRPDPIPSPDISMSDLMKLAQKMIPVKGNDDLKTLIRNN